MNARFGASAGAVGVQREEAGARRCVKSCGGQIGSLGRNLRTCGFVTQGWRMGDWVSASVPRGN